MNDDNWYAAQVYMFLKREYSLRMAAEHKSERVAEGKGGKTAENSD